MDAPRMPIVGAVVTQLRFDFAFSIDFDAVSHVRIETTFSVSALDGQEEVFDPDTDLARMATLLTLHQVKVSLAEADDAGDLLLEFSDGRRISGAPHDDYEAWTFSGPDGSQLIARPGGGLA